MTVVFPGIALLPHRRKGLKDIPCIAMLLLRMLAVVQEGVDRARHGPPMFYSTLFYYVFLCFSYPVFTDESSDECYIIFSIVFFSVFLARFPCGKARRFTLVYFHLREVDHV